MGRGVVPCYCAGDIWRGGVGISETTRCRFTVAIPSGDFQRRAAWCAERFTYRVAPDSFLGPYDYDSARANGMVGSVMAFDPT
jgi:hypothetical protein